MEFGRDWNTDKNYLAGKPFSHWAAERPGVRAATTIEVAYANAEGNVVTDQTARALGRDLARALRKHFEADSALRRRYLPPPSKLFIASVLA
jgi:hypothetical protein